MFKLKQPGLQEGWLIAILAAALLAGIAGCSKQGDVARYNPAQWTNEINAPNLSEKEFVRVFALREAAESTHSKVRITGAREVTVKFPDGAELKQFLDNAWTDAKRESDRVE